VSQDEALLKTVISVLTEVAPEVDEEVLADLDHGADLRDELDIDSMDLLNFMIGLHRETGVEIPEADYPQLVSIAGAVRYLGERRN
jgi:acyl carrier protein